MKPVLLLLLVSLLAGCESMAPRRTGDKTNLQKAAQIQVQLGSSYMQQGKLDLARDKLVRATELDPKSALAHSVLGILYEQINDDAKAEVHYQRSVELAGASGDVHNNYGQFLCRRQRYEQADAQFEAALQDPFFKSHALVATNAGICARNAGRLDDAERYLRAALVQAPDYLAALLPMASVLQAQGQHLNARAFLQRSEAAAAEPTAELLALGVEIENALGDQRAAADYRDRLLRSFPASPEARRFKE